MFDYEYVESLTQRSGENPLYRMAPEFEAWVRLEMEKRRQTLASHFPDQELLILLTSASFRRQPVFLIGIREEDQTRVLEGWYFRLLPAPENPGAAQIVLDRVNVQKLFADVT
ncbi:MAG: hypothetical protein ACO1RX_22330 [Candidatus Sericytochromatia bacterium]